MEVKRFTFLDEKQVIGKDKIDIFNKIGIGAKITDFAISQGGYYNNSGKKGENFGIYWLKKNYASNFTKGVSYFKTMHCSVLDRSIGVRPAMYLVRGSRILTNDSDSDNFEKGVMVVKYGYYPQKAVSVEMQEELNSKLRTGKVLATGKKFVVDSVKSNDRYDGFSAKNIDEYKYNGKRFARVKNNLNYDFKLSNGITYRFGDVIWFEVSPVEWYVDKNAQLVISKNILTSGIQYNRVFNDKNLVPFYQTNIYEYLNLYFESNVEQSIKEIADEKNLEMGLVKYRKENIFKRIFNNIFKFFSFGSRKRINNG